MSPATIRVSARRELRVKAKSCGHSWTIKSQRTVAEVEHHDSGYRCPQCEGVRRAVIVLHEGARRCANCKVTWLAASHEDDECFACIEARAQEQAKTAEQLWVEHLASERQSVFAALPGNMPHIIHASGVRWVDVARVLREAIRRGEVVQWNVPGRRPQYRLVNPPPGEAA